VNRSQVAERNDAGTAYFEKQYCPVTDLSVFGAIMLEEFQVPNSQVTNSETLQVLSGLDPINCIQQSTVYPLNNSDRMLWVNDRFCRSAAADGENFPLDFLH